jgi:hypothetical protein
MTFIQGIERSAPNSSEVISYAGKAKVFIMFPLVENDLSCVCRERESVVQVSMEILFPEEYFLSVIRCNVSPLVFDGDWLL